METLFTFIALYVLLAFILIFVVIINADKILNYIDKKIEEKHKDIFKED